MLFDFTAFIEELRQKQDKKEIVEKYEKLFGPVEWQIVDQNRYKEYVQDFDTIDYAIPKGLVKDYDRELLQQLVVSSFSSDYELKVNTEKKEWNSKELFIAVSKWDQSVVKTVSELRSFQVLRLYEIYVEEQMNLYALKHEDEKEKDAIDQEIEVRKRKRKAIHDTLNRWELVKEAKKEQDEKLSSLYDQL